MIDDDDREDGDGDGGDVAVDRVTVNISQPRNGYTHQTDVI